MQFALGDLSFLVAGAVKAVPSRSSPLARAEHTFQEWVTEWLDSYRPPVVGKRRHDNYRYVLEGLCRRFGDRPLAAIHRGLLLDLREDLERGGRSHRTVGDTLGVLRLVLRDAKERGLIAENPLEASLPRRSSKSARASRTRRVTFRPFVAEELERLLEVLRAPRDVREGLYFPPTEFMLLTGLRWGEVGGVLWSDVSWTGGRVHVRRTLVRGEDNTEEPTKTATTWSIPLREPLSNLLMQQQTRSRLGRAEGRIFPGPQGRPLGYTAWRRRGWQVAIQRARVAPREGDAQKACRRSYVTVALVCGRNPKQVFAEVGHTSIRMMTDVYDTFIDPANWPDSEERARLAALYGWPFEEDVRAPRGLPEAPTLVQRKSPPS